MTCPCFTCRSFFVGGGGEDYTFFPDSGRRIAVTVFAKCHRSDILSVSSWSYFDCSSMLPVLYLMNSHRKSSKIHYFLSQFWPTESPGENWLPPPNIKLGLFVGNDEVPHKALGILPALFHRWSTTRLLHKKKYPYSVLYYSHNAPYTTTLLQLYCTVLYTVLYCYRSTGH